MFLSTVEKVKFMDPSPGPGLHFELHANPIGEMN